LQRYSGRTVIKSDWKVQRTFSTHCRLLSESSWSIYEKACRKVSEFVVAFVGKSACELREKISELRRPKNRRAEPYLPAV
jgi:hypothetical protein